MPEQKKTHGRPTRLETWMNEYLIECKIKHSPLTIKGYSQRLNNFATFMRDNKITKLDREAILLWQAHLHNSGLKNSTIRQYLIEVKAFLSWCVDERDLPSNPCDKRVKYPKPDKVLKRFLTVEQTQKMLAAQNPPESLKNDMEYAKTWLFLCLILTTGARITSACKIRLCDVNFENGIIYLDKAKGDKSEWISADDYVLKLIKDYIDLNRPKDMPVDAPLLLREPLPKVGKRLHAKGEAWLVGKKYYAAMNGNYFSKERCKIYTKEICGIALSAHELRHSLAMVMTALKLTPQEIQQQLCHESLMTTLKYLHELQSQTVKKETQGAWHKIRELPASQ